MPKYWCPLATHARRGKSVPLELRALRWVFIQHLTVREGGGGQGLRLSQAEAAGRKDREKERH